MLELSDPCFALMQKFALSYRSMPKTVAVAVETTNHLQPQHLHLQTVDLDSNQVDWTELADQRETVQTLI
jgi:hypothetical protein